MAGTIEYGRDDLNLFLAPGAAPFIGGQPFSMSLTVDTGTLGVRQSTPAQTYLGNLSDSAAVNGELTINGKTFTWTTDAGSAGVTLNRDDEQAPGRQSVLMDMTARSADGLSVKAGQQFYSFFDPIIVSNDVPPAVVMRVRPGSTSATSSFEASGQGPNQQNLTTWFTASAISSAAWTVSPVPEPSQYGMLAAGIGALVFMRRRAGGRG
jgi:hypothetical protein